MYMWLWPKEMVSFSCKKIAGIDPYIFQHGYCATNQIVSVPREFYPMCPSSGLLDAADGNGCATSIIVDIAEESHRFYNNW